jgi:hypothetical protein
MVASCDVKFPIRLEGLAFAHAAFASVRLPTFLREGRLQLLTPPSVRAGALPRPHLPHALAQDCAAHLRQRQGGAHRRQGTRCNSALEGIHRSPLLQSRNDVYDAFENIYPVLTEFRKRERGVEAPQLGGAAAAAALPGPGT